MVISSKFYQIPPTKLFKVQIRSKIKEKKAVRPKKSRIRETKHLSTDADSSTDTTVGWTKNTQKQIFFEKVKKSPKTQKLKNI